MVRQSRLESQSRLRREVRYLVIRFARHAPRWQFVIWLRQIVLFAIVNVIELVPLIGVAGDELPEVVENLKWSMVGLVAVVVVLFWLWHRRVQPYVFRYQVCARRCRARTRRRHHPTEPPPAPSPCVTPHPLLVPTARAASEQHE